MNSHQQFRSLTALKGLFILLIVLHNTFSIHPLFDAVPGTSFITLFGGTLGNSMFFMLSGFLLAYNYRDLISNGAVSFRVYLLRRLSKLYPLYLLTNGISCLIAIVQHGMSAINIKKIIFTLLLQIGGGLENGNPYNSPTWFLSALFVCYIIFYFVCFYAKNPTQYFCTLAICISWGYFLQKANIYVPFCYSETGSALLNFFIGCILKDIYLESKVLVQKYLRPVSIFLLLSALYLMLRFGVEIISGDVGVAFSFFLCPLILYLALADGLCARFLSLKPLVLLGNISVSIFFWHLPLYYLFEMVLAHLLPGTTLRETHYMLYLLALLVWSIFSSVILKKWLTAHKNT